MTDISFMNRSKAAFSYEYVKVDLYAMVFKLWVKFLLNNVSFDLVEEKRDTSLICAISHVVRKKNFLIPESMLTRR